MPQGKSVIRENKSQNQSIISVFLRLHNGNGCLLSVSPKVSLTQFKKLVSETELELPSNFRLVFQGKILNKAEETLTNLGISNGSIIHIDNCQCDGPVRLKLDVCFIYQGEKIVIRAGREETILNLKTKIFRLIGILPRNQLVIFRGTRLEDTETLAFYNIAEDSLLSLHTNAQVEETEKTETPFNDMREPISATVSVNFTRNHGNLNMFRSESMGIQKEPYEIQIREANNEDLVESKEFKFQLLPPITSNFTSELSENMSIQSSNSQTEYKILVNAQDFSRNELMII